MCIILCCIFTMFIQRHIRTKGGWDWDMEVVCHALSILGTIYLSHFKYTFCVCRHKCKVNTEEIISLMFVVCYCKREASTHRHRLLLCGIRLCGMCVLFFFICICSNQTHRYLMHFITYAQVTLCYYLSSSVTYFYLLKTCKTYASRKCAPFTFNCVCICVALQ